MKRKGLYLMIALALGGAAFAVQAQNAPADQGSSASNIVWPNGYDTRWYIAPSLGYYHNDSDRQTEDGQLYYGIGVGRFISPNASIDFFVDRTNRDFLNSDSHWANNSVGVTGRYYFGQHTWRPYVLGSVMGSRHMNKFDHGWSPAAELGFGVSTDITPSVAFRVEAAYRYDWDDDTYDEVQKTNPANTGNGAVNNAINDLDDALGDGYGDWRIGASIVAKLGSVPVAPAAAPTCDQLDDDNDGVNNCQDVCPNTTAGTVVGPDGCPMKVVIDLRGVNFKFDRPKKGETNIGPTLREPTSDSLAILNQAVDTLQRYPGVVVTVAGYTDSTGPASYNQGLSERRAAIVYNYLTSHGINPNRLQGPVGYGENDPVATNSTKAGRALNRRTELQVDNSTMPNQSN